LCKDLFLDRAKLHDDIRLLGKALKQRWEIPEEFRQVIMSRLRDMIESSPDDEIVLKAIVQIRNMESQNQKDEHNKAVAALESLSNRIADMASRARVAIPGDGGPVEDSPDSWEGNE
jgi:HD-like signal output (HDOD) protein